MILGWGVERFLPHQNSGPCVQWGKLSPATSVGITARVLKDLGRTTKEARIILGAAVIDDVIGASCPARVSGIIVAPTEEVPGFSALNIGTIIFKEVAFLVLPFGLDRAFLLQCLVWLPA